VLVGLKTSLTLLMKSFQVLIKIFLESCLIVGLFAGGVWTGNNYAELVAPLPEQTNLCYDTPKYEAWVAHKNGFSRCFFEQRSYPHRVRASHIEREE